MMLARRRFFFLLKTYKGSFIYCCTIPPSYSESNAAEGKAGLVTRDPVKYYFSASDNFSSILYKPLIAAGFTSFARANYCSALASASSL